MSLLYESMAISRELGMLPLAARVQGSLDWLIAVEIPDASWPSRFTLREVEVLRLVLNGSEATRYALREGLLSPE